MSALLLDTHAWAWSLTDDARLSQGARQAVAAADSVHVSPITFYEIGQKVRLGKWPAMAPHLAALPELLRRQGGLAARLSPEICLAAATLDWPHRDPFDRLIAATARAQALTLVSIDAAFDSLPVDAAVLRVW